MRQQIARIAGLCFACGILVAFAALLFILRFAWSSGSLYAGAAVAGIGAVLAVAGFGVTKFAARSPRQP